MKIDYDRAFVAGLRFPNNWWYKKFFSRMVESARPRLVSAAKRRICRDLFDGDGGRYRQFEREVRTVNDGIRAALDEILKSYRVTRRDVIWRHTETRVENLHFDIDRQADSFRVVRLYYNMDDAPRLWHTTHGLKTVLDFYYEPLGLAAFAGAPLELLLRELSVRLFGNWQARGREQFPRHMVLFEPEDIWIADGRTVPHQVIFGRRVASAFYQLDDKALPPWHPSLGKSVAAMHAARAGGLPAAPPVHDMRGYVYPFGGKGAPAGVTAPRGSLADHWAESYEASRRQTLVRL